MPIKQDKQTYYVRNFPLHKTIVNSVGRKTRQVHNAGESIELTEAEAEHYQHLIETEEQYKSRQTKSKTGDK